MDTPSNTQFIDAPEDGPVGPKHVELSNILWINIQPLQKLCILLDYIYSNAVVSRDFRSTTDLLIHKLRTTRKKKKISSCFLHDKSVFTKVCQWIYCLILKLMNLVTYNVPRAASERLLTGNSGNAWAEGGVYRPGPSLPWVKQNTKTLHPVTEFGTSPITCLIRQDLISCFVRVITKNNRSKLLQKGMRARKGVFTSRSKSG